MFILNFRATKKKAIVAIGIILIISIFAWYFASSGKFLLYRGEDLKDRCAYLSYLGYDAISDSEYESEILIPEDFSDTYNEYNNKQIEAGFDLSNYKNVKAKMFTYRIDSFGKYSNVYAALIVYDGKIIGGDISSIENKGFILPLKTKSKNLSYLKES